MLCGCTNPVEPGAGSSTTPDAAAALRHGVEEGRRLVARSPPSSSLRRCFSARVRPSSAGVPPADSDESLRLGAEARPPAPRMRSYTLTDGAASAIGRILTCFQDGEDAASSDERPPRPRSRSLWSRRRSPASCLPTGGAAGGAGCIVDVVLDRSPGTVRRRRLEAQSVASTSSTLPSDSAAVWLPATTPGSEASCQLTATSSDRLCRRADPPVWERRHVQRGRRGRLTERQRPPAAPQSAPVSDIPRPRDCSDVTRSTTPARTAGDSTPSRRRVARRATTSAIPRPQVRVVQSASSGGGGQPVKTEGEVSVKVTTASCRVSWWLEFVRFSSRWPSELMQHHC